MGCDIHPYVEIRMADGTWVAMDAPERLDDRTYGRFAFLTGGAVRNYSGVPKVLPEPRGYPEDGSDVTKARIKGLVDDYYGGDYGNHSASYLTLTELLAVDYNQKFVDMRPGYLGQKDFVPGEPITLLEFLGEGWADILKELVDMTMPGSPDGLRIVFDFDS
jgi:hypothetical protein